MAFFIYNIATLLLIIPVFIFNAIRSLKLGWEPAVFERFGFISPRRLADISSRRIIMVHAVSVGEVAASRPLIKELKRISPDIAVIVTCGTETGRRTAASIPEVDIALFLPFDFLFSVKRFLSVVTPSIIIIMETEIWLNLIHEAYSRNIPILLANGRISEKSFRRYTKFSWLFKSTLERFTHICMQSQTYRERIIRIGAPENRVTVNGNLKYDISFKVPSPSEKSSLKSACRIPEDAFVITAGSTHDGEDEIIISAYRELILNYGKLFLVLAPRHPQRIADVETVLAKDGIKYTLLSQISAKETLQNYGEVLLVDTVGELLKLYSVSDLAFVGGSLVPVGGHNLLEPASVGVPSLYGEYIGNFKEIEELVNKFGAGAQISSVNMLKIKIQELIENNSKRERMSMNSLEMIRQSRGSTESHVEVFRRYITDNITPE